MSYLFDTYVYQRTSYTSQNITFAEIFWKNELIISICKLDSVSTAKKTDFTKPSGGIFLNFQCISGNLKTEKDIFFVSKEEIPTWILCEGLNTEGCHGGAFGHRQKVPLDVTRLEVHLEQ